MLRDAVKDVRTLMDESVSYRTNGAPAAVVAAADRLDARARKLADVWIPVKEAICQSVTNEEQAATITLQVDQAKAKTLASAKALGDLSDDAYSALSDVEHDFNRFMKLTVLPPAAMEEDLVAQSNAWQDVEMFNGRPWQNEALDFTRAFRAKFPAWARAYEQQAQADTNKPPFTAEAQAEVSALSTEVEKLQIELAEDASGDAAARGAKQLDVLKKLHRIQELLPNDGKGGGQNQQQNQQNQQNQQQQQDKQKQEPQQNQQDQQKPEDDPQQDQQEQQEQKDGAEEEQQPKEDQDVEDVLRKAQERSDEHENEKKARMRNVPLPPNERDW